MNYELLEVVVLARDVPEEKLRAGDLGTIVEIYDDRNVEVEFILSSGDTQAVLTLSTEEIRKRQPSEISAARSINDGA